MKKISTLFAILAASFVALTSCKDEVPRVPTTEPYLNMSVSSTTIALGDVGKLKVVLDRLVTGPVGGTLTSSSPALAIETGSFSIDPSSKDKSFETNFTTNSVGEAIIEIASDYPGVRYTAKTIKVNVAKPKLTLSGATICLVGEDAGISISSDMEVVEDLVITLTSSDPTKLTVPASVTLAKGSRKVTAKMTGVAKGNVEISFAISSDKVEAAQGASKINISVEEAPVVIKPVISFEVSTSAPIGNGNVFKVNSDIKVEADVEIKLTSSDKTIALFPVETVKIVKGESVGVGYFTTLKAGEVKLSIASDDESVVINEATKEVTVTVAAVE